jgi:hypothetical protein
MPAPVIHYGQQHCCAEEARAGYGTAGDHWGVAVSSLVRAQGAIHAGEVSTVAIMTAEILRHSEVIGYDVFVVPAILLEAWVAERRNEPGAAPCLAAHARVQLARVLEAAGDADTAETLYRSVVEWSETPRPRQVRESLFVGLAGSPGAAALRGLARLAAARGDGEAPDDLHARAAAMAERDRASPDALRGAAAAT